MTMLRSIETDEDECLAVMDGREVEALTIFGSIRGLAGATP